MEGVDRMNLFSQYFVGLVGKDELCLFNNNKVKCVKICCPYTDPTRLHNCREQDEVLGSILHVQFYL